MRACRPTEASHELSWVSCSRNVKATCQFKSLNNSRVWGTNYESNVVRGAARLSARSIRVEVLVDVKYELVRSARRIRDRHQSRPTRADHGGGVRPVVAGQEDVLSGSAGGSDGSDGGLDGGDPGSEVGEVVWNDTSRLIVRQRPRVTWIVDGGY